MGKAGISNRQQKTACKQRYALPDKPSTNQQFNLDSQSLSHNTKATIKNNQKMAQKDHNNKSNHENES